MWHRNAYIEYDVFSANQTISPSGLKTLVVAKGRENGVGRGEQGRTGGMGSDRAGNGVGRGGIGSNGVGNGVGNRVENRVGWWGRRRDGPESAWFALILR